MTKLVILLMLLPSVAYATEAKKDAPQSPPAKAEKQPDLNAPVTITLGKLNALLAAQESACNSREIINDIQRQVQEHAK